MRHAAMWSVMFYGADQCGLAVLPAGIGDTGARRCATLAPIGTHQQARGDFLIVSQRKGHAFGASGLSGDPGCKTILYQW